MAMKYLSKDVLQGFDKYKYSSVDTSPLSNYVMHPFWNWLVQFVPMRIAPNALTFGGFMLLVLQFFILTYYDANFYASDDKHPEYPPIPRWVWMVAALCMFWAHQLDGIDGKQARRTGTSSPLGELFDHGLDSWATLFMPIAMYSVFGRGEFSITPERTMYVVMGVMLLFYVSHWEKYITGVLFLTWGYDISQLSLTLLYIVTYFGDYNIWKFSIVEGITPSLVFELTMHVSIWVCGIPVSLYNIYVSYRDKTCRNLSLFEALRPLVPPVMEFGLFLTWVHFSSYNILIKHPRLFLMTIGTLFSNITCRDRKSVV